MKAKKSFTLDKEVVLQLKKQRVLHGCESDSVFLGWVLRQVLYKPKEVLRIKAKLLAQELAFIQSQIKDYNEDELERAKELKANFNDHLKF